MPGLFYPLSLFTPCSFNLGQALYYERLLASKDRNPVREEAEQKLAEIDPLPQEFVRDPVLLEFLGIPETGRLLESKLEDALISNL